MGRNTFKKIIVTPELLSQVSEINLKLQKQFLREKNTRCSDLTIINYESDLNIFFVYNYLNNSNKSFIDIRKLEFSDFFSFAVSDLKWGSSRFSRMKSTLSSFSNFIEKFYGDEYPNYRNVILSSVDSMPRVEKREKTILSEEQIDYLLKYLVDNNYYQECCWLALAISSGARFSELLRFTTDIIDVNNTVFDNIFLETTKSIKTKGRTKSGKMQTKFIVKDMFIPYYELWMTERKKILGTLKVESNVIFINNDGSPIKEGIVRGWVIKFEKVLGVNVYPHSLRHYLVTHLSRIGLSSELIVELMGWKSSDMFKIYNDLTAKDRDWKELSKLKEHLENK